LYGLVNGHIAMIITQMDPFSPVGTATPNFEVRESCLKKSDRFLQVIHGNVEVFEVHALCFHHILFLLGCKYHKRTRPVKRTLVQNIDCTKVQVG
jgi:hypothetical protein